MVPKVGDTLLVDRQASVQFSGVNALIFRVVAVSDYPTYYGWCWLTGYVIGNGGVATERRESSCRSPACDRHRRHLRRSRHVGVASRGG
jgi:hypothetical protein